MKIVNGKKYLEVGDVVYQSGTPYVRYTITRVTKTLAIAKIKRRDNTEIEVKFKIEIQDEDHVNVPNRDTWSTISYKYESLEQSVINDIIITQHKLVTKINRKLENINLSKQDIPYLEKLLGLLEESKSFIKE